MMLRVRGPSGVTKTITAEDETLEKFCVRMQKLFSTEQKFVILSGFPLKPTSAKSTDLISTFLRSGVAVTLKLQAMPSKKRSATEKPATSKSPSYKKTATNTNNSTTWSCSACTFENSTTSRCEICQTKNEAFVSSSSSSSVGPARQHKIPDDNSCLFHAVIHLLQLNKTTNDLRRAIARIVVKDSSQWSSAMLGKSRDEYVTFITDTTKWGGQVELNILSAIYCLEIATIDIQSGRLDIYGENQQVRSCD